MRATRSSSKEFSLLKTRCTIGSKKDKISGQMNLIVGIFKRKAGKIVAQRVIGFFVKVANSIKSIEKVFSYAPVLGPLAGKDE